MVTPSDNDLIHQCLSGDREAFGSLVGRYEKPVFNVVYRILGDADDAKDATQSAFIKAYQNLAGFNSRQKFFSWLYRIAINVALTTHERRKRQDTLDDDTPSDDSSIESRIDRHDRAMLVHEALQRLSWEHRTVIVLRHFLDLSYQDMCSILSIPMRTVKSRLYEARQDMKKLLPNITK